MTAASAAAPKRRRSGFAAGVACGLRGVGLCIVTPSLWPWALFPALVTLVLFVLPFWGVLSFVEGGVRNLADRLIGEQGGQWVGAVVTVLVVVVALVVAYLVFAPLARIIAAPFLAVLSDRTVARVAGGEVPAPPGGLFVRLLWNPVGDALLFLSFRIVVTLFALPLFLVPVAGPFLFFAAMVPLEGLDRMDVAQSSRGLSVGRRLSFLRREFGACCGLGLIAATLLLVPIVNVMLLPGLAVGAVLLDAEISDDFPRAVRSDA